METRLNVIGGGIFSKFMRLIQYTQQENLIVENTYLDVIDTMFNINENMIDYCIQQEQMPNVEITECSNYETFDKKNRIESSIRIITFKSMCEKIIFTKKLNDLIELYTQKFVFDSNTIGVHIRLCDMNIMHAENYGKYNFENFTNKLDKILTPESKIFVASDNNESLKKLELIYGDKIFFVPNMIRVDKEDDNSYQLQVDNLSNPDFWIESFLEMILLSKCSKLICRTSNLSNASLCFSKTIEEVIRL
jgi:hypothetical protein